MKRLSFRIHTKSGSYYDSRVDEVDEDVLDSALTWFKDRIGTDTVWYATLETKCDGSIIIGGDSIEAVQVIPEVIDNKHTPGFHKVSD